MNDRERIGQIVREHYEERWSQGDPWERKSSDLEWAKFARQVELLADRRYGRVLELGCGNGRFTAILAGIAEQVVAIDVAPSAIARARAEAAAVGTGTIDFRIGNVMEYDPVAEGPWDLIVMMETIYCLGWLYPVFDVAWMASQLFAATRPGGRFLLTNTYGHERDWLLRPWLIDTYRDLFRNVGYRLVVEEVFSGDEHGVALRTPICLFKKP